MGEKGYRNTLVAGTLLHGGAYSYRIERVLGQGSFGITYLATVKMQGALGSIDANVKVAIKEFFMKEINGREGTAVTSGSKGGVFADYRKKFVREAANLSKLRHPNIIKVLECFEANGTVYYAMEYIDGGSLDELISKRGRLTEAETLRYARQIADALAYMHDHNVLHLDLKPGNIMLRDGNAVLIDFGLSKQYDASGNPESSTTVGGGTPGYAPIEQASYHEGKGFPVTMDIYALGGTMLKMLTGKRPPDASEILNDGFPSDWLRGVTPATAAVVEKAMSPLRKDRYQSAPELIAAINKLRRTASNDIPTTETEETTDFDTRDIETGTTYDDSNKVNISEQSFFESKEAQIAIKVGGFAIAAYMIFKWIKIACREAVASYEQYLHENSEYFFVQVILCGVQVILCSLIIGNPQKVKQNRLVWLGILIPSIVYEVMYIIHEMFGDYDVGLNMVLIVINVVMMIILPKLNTLVIRLWTAFLIVVDYFIFCPV